MKQKRPIFLFIVFITLWMVFLSGCAIPAMTESSARPNQSTPSAQQTLKETLPPATATLVQNTPSPKPTPSPTPVLTVKPSSLPASPFVVNWYTASDGEYIYYYSGDGVRRMSLDGRTDTRTKVQGSVFRFIYLDANDLYYITTEDYYPKCLTNHGQSSHSFSLMVYNMKAGKIHTIQKHLRDVAVAGSKIYMMDHDDHVRIRSFDIKTKKTNKVTCSIDLVDYIDTGLVYGDGKAYLYLGSCYLITGDTVDEKPLDLSFPLEKYDYQHFDFEIRNDDCQLFLRNGSDFKDTGIRNVYDCFEVDEELCVVTLVSGKTNDNGSQPENVTIYMVGTDGSIEKVLEKTCIHDSTSSLCFEYIKGWLFCFSITGEESGMVDGYLLKQKIG